MKQASRPTRITSRAQLIQRIRSELETRSYPRLQMSLLVALTGGAGFITSYALLTLGVDSLPLRYFLSVGVAYLAFLLLLWLWMRTSAKDYDGTADAIADALDAIPDGAARADGHIEPGGGEFGGGGSTGHWDASSPPEPLVDLPDMPTPDLDAAPEVDDLAIPLAVLAALAAVAFGVVIVSVSMIWSAPILFSELVVDGVLSATLYRRLRRIEPRHWLQSAVRRTLVPFAITAILAAGIGWGLSWYTPTARTLGEVFQAGK